MTVSPEPVPEPAKRTGGRLRIAMLGRPWIEVPPRGHGGVERICGLLVNELVRRGHDVTLIGAGSHGTDAKFYATFPTTQLHHGLGLIPELAHAAKARQLLSSASPPFDIVHDHTLIGPMLGPLVSAPIVSTVHDPVIGEAPDDKFALLGEYYEALSEHANLISVSHAQRNDRPELNWVGTVHNGIDVTAHPFNAATREDFVLWVGRFVADKGPDLAIQVCREAGLPLVLAGRLREPERAYFDSVVAPQLTDGVEVLANVDQRQVTDLMARARCLLHPVRFREPFGMVLAEAAACGTPVVGLHRGAVAEVVADGVTGWVCRSVDELPAALYRAAEIDPVACRLRTERLFSAEAMAEGYERIYRAVIGRS